MDDGSPVPIGGFVILIAVLLLGGAYFAATETALASVNRIRMMSNAANGDRRAKRVLYILDHFDKALSALLIGNNIMHIGCASTATLLATKLWGTGAVSATTFVTTFVVFFFAEMLPKRFAKVFSEQVALRVSGSLIFLIKVLSPLVFLFSRLTALVTKPFRKAISEEPTVTEDELYDIIETIAQEGSIDEEKTELVQSALEFSDIVASEVMTPWARVLTVREGTEDEKILSTIRENTFSRLPVVNAGGTVTGLLNIRKYLKAYLKHSGVRLADVMDPVHFVPGSTAIDDLLPLMSGKKTQIAVVLGEGGETIGIITVEDILEELVGEIYDEDDTGEADAPSPECGGAA